MISINDITSVLELHNKGAIPDVLKAYKMAEEAHGDTKRESGEPYITHPLHVAKNLLDMEIYDTDTICAALLHDVVEDTNITLKDIEELLNPTVAELVDGVTKIRRMNFSTKEAQNQANTRKIINGLNKDVRIILIKLADRLHNMRTLDYKKPNKQQENAIETMELYVPLALSIGAYQIKSQLEDLALKYIQPSAYKRIEEKRAELLNQQKDFFDDIRSQIGTILLSRNIPNEILLRRKSISNIYWKIVKGYEMENIYDLFYLKVLVDELEDCFRTLAVVHELMPPINGRFKDYIFNPRTNHYQSLHTTVSTGESKLLKVKIRTFDMDKVSAFGISAYWNLKRVDQIPGIPRRKTIPQTQLELSKSLQFAKKAREIDGSIDTDYDFIAAVKKDLLTDHVYVYNMDGDIIELPAESTALDFACQAYPELLDRMTGVLINDMQQPVSKVLENNDTVQIRTTGIVDRKDWEDSVNTALGKRKVYLLQQQI